MRSSHVLLKYLYVFMFLLVLGVTSCGDGSDDPDVVVQPPTAAFSFQAKGQLVAFQVTRPSNPATQDLVEWNFGDGQTAIGANPVHLFSQPGAYNVTIEYATGTSNVSAQQTVHVEASENCDADATWKSVLPTEFGFFSRVIAGDPGFVGLNRDGNIYFSENGLQWCDVPEPGSTFHNDAEWADNQFWILQNQPRPQFSPNQSVLWSSQDGKQWSQVLGPPMVAHRFSVSGERPIVIGGDLAYNITPGSSLFVQEADGSWREAFNPQVPLWDVFWSGNTYLLFGRSNEELPPGAADHLWTSSNGLDWTAQSIEDLAWDRIASNGTRYVRAHDVMETSTDGITWTPANLALPEPILQVSWGNDQFLAFSSNYAYQSNDGVNWNLHELPSTVFDSEVNVAWNGWIWILADNERPKIWSGDGDNWRLLPGEALQEQRTFWTAALAEGANFKVAGSRLVDGVREKGFLLETDDGAEDTVSRISETLETLDLENTVYGLMACGDSGSSLQPSGDIYLENNGGWQQVFSTNSPILNIAAKDNQVVATTLNGQVLVSPNGQSWQVVTNIDGVQALESYGDYFAILTRSGNLHRSLDGVSWETIDLPVDPYIPRALAFSNGVWLLLANDLSTGGNAWMRSSDMRDWSFFNPPFSTAFVSLSANEQGFYALGRRFPQSAGPGSDRFLPHAPMIWSADGITWEAEPLPNMVSPYIVRAGSQGAIVLANKKIFLRGLR